MKRSAFLALALLLLGGCASATPTPSPEGLAVYLLAEEGPAALLEGVALDDLALAETPIIGPADIRAYDAATHTMSISEEAMARVRALFEPPVPTGGVPFVMTANGERIYAGAFWTMLSSLSYDGVVILDPLPLSSVMPGDLRITLGYPAPELFTGEDPRSDPRILEALEP
ncbi:MAG: hypothetical protein GX579_09190 [Chloroflexi bacterium]|jgi:hypothetical protein|nr:hypothetical protein [Chloroflexota bacterium]